MSRPDPPFYVGRTRPGVLGWTRVGLTAAMSVIMLVLGRSASTTIPPLLAVLIAAVIALMALWSWSRLWTRFIVDEHGVTVSRGGFWPQRPWPLADFRTVQLREIPSSSLGVTVGPLGRPAGRVMVGEPGERRVVAGRPVRTPEDVQARYRMQVSAPGTMVEIIGRGQTHYLLSPVDPERTALAIDQAIRARR
ncbi:hypothetical protein [Brachybacterium hainanense]|uniref:DUF3093 domain-containing protein n=1 Tax=Brachybacterium hainanense TaxID=1541174 RepID=A0ABV6RB21_9MICO